MRHWRVARRILLVALAACLLCFGTAEAKKPDNPGGGGGGDKGPSYQIIKLDTDDGDGGTVSGTAFDINDSRLIVGGVNVSIGGERRSRAAYWAVTELDGTFESKLRFLDEALFTNTGAYGCNEGGEIVGYGGDEHSLAALYWADPNSPVELLPAPSTFSGAEAISNDGVICGWSFTGFDATAEKRALVWSFDGVEWKYLELTPQGDPGQDENGNPLPDQSFALAVSDEDPVTGVITVVGRSNGNAVAWTVMLDGAGGLAEGPAAILDPGAEALGLNNTGMVCGWGHLGPSSGGDGVVWVDGGSAQLLERTYSQWGNPRQVWPYDVNDGGLIVGYSLNQAVLWPNKDAPPILLDKFLGKGKNAAFSSLGFACAVSESDEIVGRGCPPYDQSLAFPFLAVPK